MWTVSFTEYVKFEGVKESIKETKSKKKALNKNTTYGTAVEKAISSILEKAGFKVKHTTPQMDIGFGADLLVSYVEKEKNYSFYMDVTSMNKDISYLSFTGALTEDMGKAFRYTTNYGIFYFGIKKQHASHFYYKKPVVVVYVEKLIPYKSMYLGRSHLANIKGILISANEILMKQGYGARASKLIRPNPKKFGRQFKQYIKSIKSMDQY